MPTTTTRAIVIAAALLALAIAAAAWWIASAQSADRYQLVNVGGGETQRLDRELGTITSCIADRCIDLTDGAEPKTEVAGADQWPGTPVPRAETN